MHLNLPRLPNMSNGVVTIGQKQLTTEEVTNIIYF